MQLVKKGVQYASEVRGGCFKSDHGFVHGQSIALALLPCRAGRVDKS